MGRFAWTPSHRSVPSDGKHGIPDWFSKTSGEPSRQALSELVKEHQATSPPCTTGNRTRTNTLSSTPSRGHKSASSRSSSSRQSRPASQQDQAGKRHSNAAANDKSVPTIFSKGSKMMRRQTSKFTVLSTQLNEAVNSSDHQSRTQGIQRVKSAGHLLNLHPKREGVRPQISGPFDFQHVTHTDQSQYQNLCKTNETDLTHSFGALQADQQPQHEIRGIPVDDLRTVSSTEQRTHPSRPQSPAFSIVPSLPAESPKPSPPPKDFLGLPPVDIDVRMSRSMENFSYPNRSSPLLDSDHLATEHSGTNEPGPARSMPVSPIRPTAADVQHPSIPPSPLYAPSLAPSPMLDKPLPQPPTVVHAVSTSDLSSLFLKSTPLPEVPQQQAERSSQGSARALQLDSVSPKGGRTEVRHSIRHMQSFPVDRLSRRRSTSSAEISNMVSPVAPATTASIMPRSAHISATATGSTRILETEDWEEAIDYSWDHALDSDDEDVMEMYDTRNMTKSDILPQSSFGSGYTSDAVSQPDSLPVQGIRQHKSEMSLRGLGINPASRYSSMYGHDYGVNLNKRESLRVPYTFRTSGSPISKSSSQESIILSIASSIMSTHRSSNSSTSIGDINHLCSIEDESIIPGNHSHAKPSNAGSVSSSETVTTDNKSLPSSQPLLEEDTIVELPTMTHQRGASTPMFPAPPNRRSSMTPSAKVGSRQRSHTLTHRSTNSRASYSLFPTARPTPHPA